MLLSEALPLALNAARSRWADASLRAVSGHALRADGRLERGEGLWFFLFSTQEGPRAVTWRNGELLTLEQPPVPAMLVPPTEVDAQRVPCSARLAAHYCGHAGWDGLDGRPEDSLWLGSREGQVVAVISGKGGATAVLDAYQPNRVVTLDFEPVTMRGETV
jgi:hypothetical protein